MSRYVIWTSDDNLEVFVGYDEGMEGFFITIADVRLCTGETGSYLFHNLDHHPRPQMTLEEVATTLASFGLALPHDLGVQLASDGTCRCPVSFDGSNASFVPTDKVRIVGWQNAA